MHEGPLESKGKEGAKGALTKGSFCAATLVSFLSLTLSLHFSQSCGPLALERSHGCGCQAGKRLSWTGPLQVSLSFLLDSGETVAWRGCSWFTALLRPRCLADPPPSRPGLGSCSEGMSHGAFSLSLPEMGRDFSWLFKVRPL